MLEVENCPTESKSTWCSDPFQKHKVPFRANKSKLRVITPALAENDPQNLKIGTYICNSCRHTATQLKKLSKTSLGITDTAKQIHSAPQKKSTRKSICGNPFLLHKERRRKSKKSWYYVSAKLSRKCAFRGVIVAEGLQLCYECYIKCLSSVEDEQLKSIDCYCRDPMNRHAKPRKKNILFCFKKPSLQILNICHELGYELESDDYICTHCRNFIKKKKKTVTADCNDRKRDTIIANSPENLCNVADTLEIVYSESEQSLTSDSENSHGSIYSSDSDYCDSDIEVDEINQVLNNLKLNNITKSYRHTDENLKKLQAQICERVKSSLSKLAKRNIDFDKPVFFYNDRCKCKECKICIASLAARIKEASKTEKYQILTCTPLNLTMKEIEIGYEVSQKMAEKSYALKKASGPFSAPSRRVGKKLSYNLVKDAIAFYLQPENSSTCPDQRKTIIIRNFENGKMHKQPVAKQEMRVTLKELHKEFRIQFPNHIISVSKFSLLKPKQCQWGKSIGFQNTCKCINHENFKLLLEPLKKVGKTEELLTPFFCSLNENCLFGLCTKCPGTKNIETMVSELDDENIVYMEWIKGNSRAMELVKKTVSKEEYLVLIQECLQTFGPHYYVHTQQRDFIKNLQASYLIDNCSQAVMLVDFGENYSFVVANEVQSFHWNNNQCTILPCVLYYYCAESKSVQTLVYVVLSDTTTHDSNTFHVFRSKVIEQLKLKLPQIKFITYVSDNCGGQFKNKKNFCNLRYHYNDFQINSKWIFSAAGHGKGLSDAYSAITKRSTRLESLRRGSFNPILDVQSMYKFLNEAKTSDSLKFLMVTDVEIADYIISHNIEERYTGLKTVKGTRLFHDVEVGVEHRLHFKKVSASMQSFEFNIFGENEEPECCTQLEINLGNYVAFIYGSKVLAGVVESVIANDGEYEIRMMKKLEKGKGYKWHDPVKIDCVPFIDIVGLLNVPTTPNGRVYNFDSNLHDKMIALAGKRITTKRIKL